MRKWIVRAGLVVLIVLVVSQFIPVDRTNPPVESDGSVSDLHFIELDHKPHLYRLTHNPTTMSCI
jgi:hypothetical protein